MATEEEAVCLSHDGDSRCLNSILGREGKTVRMILPTNQENRKVTRIFGMLPAQVLPTTSATVTSDPVWAFPAQAYTFCVSWTVLRSISNMWFCSPPTSSMLLSVSRRLCMSSLSSSLWGTGKAKGPGPQKLQSFSLPIRCGTLFPSPELRSHLQIIKYNEAPTGHILEVVLGEKKDTIFQALDLPNVITAVDLKR